MPGFGELLATKNAIFQSFTPVTDDVPQGWQTTCQASLTLFN